MPASLSRLARHPLRLLALRKRASHRVFRRSGRPNNPERIFVRVSSNNCQHPHYPSTSSSSESIREMLRQPSPSKLFHRRHFLSPSLFPFLSLLFFKTRSIFNARYVYVDGIAYSVSLARNDRRITIAKRTLRRPLKG